MKRYPKVTIIVFRSTLIFCIIIAGCSYKSYSRIGNNNLSLRIPLLENDFKTLPETSEPIERTWVRYNKLNPNHTTDLIILSFLHKEENGFRQESTNIEIDKSSDLWPKHESKGDPVHMVFENELGTVTFKGQIGSDNSGKGVTAFGTVSIECNNDSIGKIEKEFDQELSLDTLITLVMRNITVETLTEYASIPVELNIKQAGLLLTHNYKPQTIQMLIENGLDFNSDDLINLATHYVTADYVIDWKKAGYDLSADQLVYANQRFINAQDALPWKDAGYDLSIEQLHWVKQRFLNASEASEWKKSGYNLSIEQLHWVKQRFLNPSDASLWKNAGYDLSIEQLHWIKQRFINASEASAWKSAGYELSIEQLHWAKQRFLNTSEASAWKKAGYNFSIEDLHELKQHFVNASFGASLADPSYENLSVKQLIELKNSNMSAETIKRLRKPKVY